MTDQTGTKTTGQTTMARVSDREFVATATIHGPVSLAFRAWTEADLFRQWWVPKSFGLTLLACELDVRTGGSYRLVFSHPESAEPMAFHGRYMDVVANARIVWTNEEEHGDGQVSTVTFTEADGKTQVVMHDLYPSKDALDEAMVSGSTSGMEETFGQLDALVQSLAG